MGVYDEMLEAFRSGENERARQLSAVALEAAEASHDLGRQVDALCMLSRVALRESDFEQVRELADEAASRARAAGDPQLEQMPLHMRAVAARMSGESGLARELYVQSIELNRSLGEERMVAAEQHNLAYVELQSGKPDRAKELFKLAREDAQRIAYKALDPYLVGDLAVVAEIDADPSAAARLAGAAAAAFAAVGQVPDPDDAAEQQRLRERLTRELGTERFDALYDEGSSLSTEEVLSHRDGGEGS